GPELDALAAYVTSLDRVPPSPYRAPDGHLTPEGWRGREVFQRAGCPECHSGPDFTDSASGVLHDVGTLQATSGKRLGEPLLGLDTPTLRGIWQTAPYLHDGSAPTLLDVIVTKNPDDRHGATRDLTDTERHELTSYLLQIDNTALEDEVEPPQPPAEDSGSAGCSVGTGPWPSAGTGTLFGLLALLGAGARRGARRARAPARH